MFTDSSGLVGPELVPLLARGQRSLNNGNSITNRFHTADLRLLLSVTKCSGGSTGSSQQTAGSPLVTGGRVVDTGGLKGLPVQTPDDRLDFWLFERRFEAAQPETNVPLGPTPPRVQPPIIPPSESGSSGRPILHGAEKIRHHAAALKGGPTLLTVALAPSR